MNARPTDLSLPELQARGYFRASRKYRYAVRIDRPDWLRAMLRGGHPSATVVELIRERGLNSLASSYRVSFSADVVELPSDRMAEFLQLEHTQWADSIYRPAPGDPVPEPWSDREVDAVRALLAEVWPGLSLARLAGLSE